MDSRISFNARGELCFPARLCERVEMNGTQIEDRCSLMCGIAATDCLNYSERQIDCIADMVLNRVWPVKLLLEDALKTGRADYLIKHQDEITGSLQELIDWARHIQRRGALGR